MLVGAAGVKPLEKIVYAVASLLVVLAIGSTSVGMLTQPWAPWWFAGGSLAIEVTPPVADIPLSPPVPSPRQAHTSGTVSDVQRYLLAVGAGFVGADAITATALSIAEDGSGDPAALSAPNFDGSRDLGLWQINSGWWPQFGGQAALTNPVTNALAAYAIYKRQGWCAWSTYEESCGRGHNSAYRAYLARARAAAVLS